MGGGEMLHAALNKAVLKSVAKLSLMSYDVAQLENCSTASGLQLQSYDRRNWCSLTLHS